ncbi:hypothetical protein BJ912DRAFT_1056612 [Pholiota molesta]|nr:hypothetical protein BJ912DRAFT_1056612 [Pholiota molesta]
MDCIPINLRVQLLPSPLLSVSDFLRFELPTQLSDARRISDQNHSVTAAEFGRLTQPDSRDIVNIIKFLPVPSASLLDDLLSSEERKNWRSVRYAHLPAAHSASQSSFPIWIIAYWVEVARLQTTVRRPWVSAEAFLKKTQQTWKAAEARQLADAATIALVQLPWGGRTTGFGADNEPIHVLARYLSDQWLQSKHIIQQLEILRLDLKRAGTIDCEVITPYTFEILVQMYRTREATPYRKDGFGVRKNIWGIGEELASGRRKVVAGVSNVNNNHWVGIVIDVADLTVRYGDSLGGAGAVEIMDAVIWWLQFHIPSPFKRSVLPITQQTDDFSCGVLALNAIRHMALPNTPLLQPLSGIAINQERVDMFVSAVKLDLQSRINDVPPHGQTTVYNAVCSGEEIEFALVFVEVNVPTHMGHIEERPPSPFPPAPADTHVPVPIIPPPQPMQPGPLRVQMKSASLTKWFKPATSEEVIRSDRERMESEHQATMEKWSQQDKLSESRKRMRQTEGARERQAKKRQLGKDLDFEAGRRDRDGKLIKVSPSLSSLLSDPPPSSLNVAEASRPKRSLHEQERQQRGKVGRPRVSIYKPASQTNWMSPLLWIHIDRAATRCLPKMSPAEICRELKKVDPVLFKALHPQTLRKWIDSKGDAPRWSDRTLERVVAGHSPGGLTTRIGILIKYPEVTTIILKSLRDLRVASVALTLTTIRGIIIGHLQHHVPEIFTTPAKDGTFFRASEEFVRKFVRRALGWSLRRSTRAGGKIPSDFQSHLQKAFIRMAYCIKDENIPSALIVNSDQTQLTLAQGCHMTYAEIGSRQVVTVGSEEKRAITVMASLSNDGTLLPFQAIYQGKTAASQPSKNSRSYAEALAAGFLFESSNSSTYWSTQETMRSFVDHILVPYFTAVKTRLGLPLDQRSLWQIDCWSVHRSDEFLGWMRNHHPMIVINFVPARMTGLFQPVDVGLQRLFKHSMKRTAHEDVVQEVIRKLESGTLAEEISIDSKLSVLRNRTVHWMWHAYTELNNPTIIKKAWKMCRVGINDADLSYESLTSSEARQTLRELPITDPTFFAELTRERTMPALPTLTHDEAQEEDVEHSELDIPGDDSAVPLKAVEDAVYGVLPTDDTEQEFIIGPYGLLSAAEAEETLVESVNDVIVDTTSLAEQSSVGRGHRKKFRNTVYNPENFDFTHDSLVPDHK